MGIELTATGDTDLTLAQQAILQTVLSAFNIMLEREKVYGSAWMRYGVSDKVMHVRDITARIEAIAAMSLEVGTEPPKKLEDLFLDLINYAAMGAFQTSEGKFS
jgi:hypothetical protein